MAITGIVARRRVPDLDAAVPFYEALTGAVAKRFEFGEARLAAVGGSCCSPLRTRSGPSSRRS